MPKNEAKVKFTADTGEFNSNIKSAKAQISALSAELKLNDTQMKSNGQSVESLQQRQKLLMEQEKQQQTVVEALNGKLQKAVECFGENSNEAIKLKTQLTNAQNAEEKIKQAIQQCTTELEAQKNAESKVKSETDKLNDSIDQQQSEVNKLKKEYVEAVLKFGEASDEAKELANQIKDLSEELNENKRKISDAEDAADKLDETLDDVGDSADKAGNGGFTVFKGVLADLAANVIRSVISGAKDLSKTVIELGQNFSESMAEVQAISGASGKELEELEKTARQYGATTVFSASEAADALKYMALAGWDVKQSQDALGGILNLAAAAGMDLAKASDMCTDYLSAFGMEAKESAYFADLLAFAQSHSNTTAEALGEAYRMVAANMHAAGQDVETTTSLLAMMANQGLKGSEAGTALAAVLRDMTKKMKDGNIVIGNTNVQVMDANGNYRDMTDILKDVENAVDGLGDAEKSSALLTTFTADSVKGLNLMLNAGIDEAANFEKQLRQSDKTAQKMSNTMNDNLSGDLKAMRSALEEVGLTAYKEFEQPLRDATKTVTKQFIPALQKDDTVKKFASGLSNIGKSVLPPLANILKFTAENVDTLAAVTLGAVTAFAAFKAVMAITTAVTAAKTAIAGLEAGVGLATKAQTLWNAAMTANPIGAVITAVGLLAAGIAFLCSSEQEAAAETDLLSKAQRENVIAAQEQAEAFKEVSAAADKKAASEIAEIDYVEKNLLPQLANLIDSNGKVKQGYEERAQFILNELNQALGTEYSSLEQIVDANGQVKESILQTIQAKKAQILLSAYEEKYKTAVQEVAAAEQARAAQAVELQKIDDNIIAKKAELEKAHKEYEQAVATCSEEEISAAVDRTAAIGAEIKELQDKFATKKQEYLDMTANIDEHYKAIDSYEMASNAVLAGETDKAIGYLNNYASGFKSATDVVGKTKEEQKQIMRQQVIDTAVNLGIMEEEYKQKEASMTDEQKRQMQARIDNARRQAENAKAEYAKVGGNSIDGLAEGVKAGEWKLTGALKTAVNSALSAAKKVLDIRSPSHVMRDEVGLMVDYGFAEGIEEGTGSILDSIEEQSREIKGAYGSYISNGVKTFIDAPNLQTSINANIGTVLDKSMQLLDLSKLISAVEHLANRAINLSVNGQRFATVTASDTDIVNGERIILKNRGLAL